MESPQLFSLFFPPLKLHDVSQRCSFRCIFRGSQQDSSGRAIAREYLHDYLYSAPTLNAPSSRFVSETAPFCIKSAVNYMCHDNNYFFSINLNRKSVQSSCKNLALSQSLTSPYNPHIFLHNFLHRNLLLVETSLH